MNSTNSLIEQAIQIRAFEQNLLDSYSKGYLNGTVHTCIGQELTPCVISFLTKKVADKFIVSNHRGHGHYLAEYPNKSIELLKEIMGRADGVSGGFGGSQHLYGQQFLSNGIQGGMIPILAGRVKRLINEGKKPIGIGYIGDGTLGQGILYESINFISISKLPILIVVEDNGWSQSTKSSEWGIDICKRFSGFGFKSLEIDSRNIIAEISNLEKIIEEVESGIPHVLRVKSYRLKAHSKGDDNRNDQYLNEIHTNDYLNQIMGQKEDLNNLYKDTLLFWQNKTVKIASLENPNIERSNYLSKRSIKLLPHFEGSYNSVIQTALMDIMSVNDNAILIGEDIRDTMTENEKDYGGAFKVTKGLSTKFPKRVINTPISEQLIAGFSTGYALYGGVAIAEIMFGDFLTLCFDQLVQHASKFTHMFGRNISIPLIIRTPMGGKRGYGPTHSQSIEKHFLGVDGLDIVALNHRIDPLSTMNDIIAKGQPTVVIENKVLYTQKFKELPLEYNIKISESCSFLEISPDSDTEIILFCYGEVLNTAEEIADKLLDEEIYIHIVCAIDLNSELNEFDWTICNNKTIVIIEEGTNIASWSNCIYKNLTLHKIQPASIKSYSNNFTIPSQFKQELIQIPNADKILTDLL